MEVKREKSRVLFILDFFFIFMSFWCVYLIYKRKRRLTRLEVEKRNKKSSLYYATTIISLLFLYFKEIRKFIELKDYK